MRFWMMVSGEHSKVPAGIDGWDGNNPEAERPDGNSAFSFSNG